jgi:general secretion pathway protein E
MTIPSLPQRFLRSARIVPLGQEGDVLTLGMADSADTATADAVALATGLRVQPVALSDGEIEAALDRLFGGGEPTGGLTDLLAEAAADHEADTDTLRDLASEAPVVRLVNRLIAQAVERRASDIHVEPFEGELRIRYRIDGQLVEQEPAARAAAAAIVSRLKLMAGLDIAERRLPQDGRIKLPVRGRDVDFRVATAPSLHGESVVLRVLDRSGVTLDFAALGLAPEQRAALLRQLDRPNGIVLVTGPTGSGKTTTLYTALERLNRPERKLVTVEDPVEYQIAGINQIQVKNEIGLDFAGVLRSTLRHDPDIIMIGEIRDIDTARIAVQAALTGHLVLSTLHTNSAAATIARLVDLGVSDYLIASTLNAVVAQRLVRVLCPDCRESHLLPAALAMELGLEGQPPIFRPKGCQACLGTGYRGRVALFEVLEIDETARERMLARQPVPKAAHSLSADGLDKVLAGVTSLDEVWAVAER